MEPKKKSRRYFGKQSAKIRGTHKRKHKEEKHKEKTERKRKIKHYRHLKER